MKKFSPPTSWILYDVANSAFTLIIITTLMPLYFQKGIMIGYEESLKTAIWGYVNSGASLVVSVLAPWLGMLANTWNRRKHFWIWFWVCGLGFCVSLGLIPHTLGIMIVLSYAAARVCWSLANLFIDAHLVDVAPPQSRDRLSARAYAWGYLGSLIPFILCIGILILALQKGNGFPHTSLKICFVVVGGWWMLFSLPWLFTRSPGSIHPGEGDSQNMEPSAKRDQWVRLFKDIYRQKKLRYFLLAYFLYIDGVYTIITMATVYGAELQLGMMTLISVVGMIQLVGFPASLAVSRLCQFIPAWKLVRAGLWFYTLITLGAFSLPYIPTHSGKIILYWILGAGIALAQGGVQSLSRSIFSNLIPAEKAGSYFGLYHIVGKFAAILGPLGVGILGQITGKTHFGVLSLVLLFGGGIWLLGLSEKNQS